MSSEPQSAPVEKRLFSDHLILQLTHELLKRELVTRAQIDELNARLALTGDTLDQILIREAVVPERDVLGILSELSGIPFRPMAELDIPAEAVGKVPPRVALRYRIMPVALDGGVITLATRRVPDANMVDSLRMLLDLAVDWVLCVESDIDKSIKHFYGLGAETIDNISKVPPTQIELPAGQDVTAETDEGVVKFVHQIIAEAIGMGATDIHIEPFEDNVRLRYRIDGMLQNVPVPRGAAHLRRAIASCVKIMAELDIAERRKPHDGRIKVRCGRDEFDLRVSVLPTAYGETVNMRILNRKSMFIDLEHLGLSEDQLPTIKYLYALPHGVILLTGPTGSGKTTTLYALLSRINKEELKIITVEDPVEYQIDGINQIQVHARIGVSFAAVLRSILRHDPDIILVGEIRDMETADIAVRASLTGHLVFSTLHTNDAPSAITRLIDMGVEPYLVSSCLEGVIAQRLVRRICESCRAPATPDDTLLEEISSMYPDDVKGATFYQGHGCPECNFTGYRGRIALFEIMVLNDALRSLVVHQRPSNEIRLQALKDGLVTLRRDGWRRALKGVTTVDEVVRVARRTEALTGPR